MKSVTLRSGNLMPILGLGTWRAEPGVVGQAVKIAIEQGYRHLDCAAVYGNEKEIGQALSELFSNNVIRREELFITSKLWNTKHKKEYVRDALLKTLQDLQVSYLDLYLIHWPHAFAYHPTDFSLKDADGKVVYDTETSYLETWEVMETLVSDGLVRDIGLSNFNSQQIEDVLKHSKSFKPSVLQVECHPYFAQRQLLQLCQQNGMHLTAYSPLGSPNNPLLVRSKPLDFFQEPYLQELARKKNKSIAQILIRFQIQRGVVVIPKSVSPHRLKENFEVFNFELTDEEMQKIYEFDCGFRICALTRDRGHPLFPFHLPY